MTWLTRDIWLSVGLVSVAWIWSGEQLANAEPARPVFQVDVPSPTKDKPQSKLWYAEGHWWAWLPCQGGSCVWQRGHAGWQRLAHLDEPLAGLPGQADVWADQDGVRAVLIGEQRLAVVGLRFDADTKTYRLAGEPTVWRLDPPARPGEGAETVTIGRDGPGRWWIAYDHNTRIWVRWSLNPEASNWSDPLEIGGPADTDDICCLVRLPGAMGVAWSDQKADAIWFRQHLDTKEPREWEPVETAAQGGKTADDHLNAAIASDGTLYLATKNSVDRIDEPQLVLRIRRPDGRWDNLPYANRTQAEEPSRPIIILAEEPRRLFLAHTIYVRGKPRPRPHFITTIIGDPEKLDLTTPPSEIIVAENDLNDATTSKANPPSDPMVPWIVLASDRKGQVYEAILPRGPAN